MSFIITFLSSFFGISGLNTTECRTTEFTTLIYHHVREYSHLDNASKNISVSPSEFREQMKFLYDNKYSVITSRNIQSGTVPCKSVMITFDDGYHDVFTEAYLIMKQYNFRGVLGLILAKIDESDYLNGEQIRKLQKEGWELASHTWHHPNLSQLETRFVPYQIDQSKKDLEKWFHTPIHIFIYPQGHYTYAALDQISLSGYSYAFTTQTGKTNLSEKPLELKRIDVIPGIKIEQFTKLLEPTITEK